MFLIGCSLVWLENVIESQMFLHVKLLNTLLSIIVEQRCCFNSQNNPSPGLGMTLK